jgi:beta-galactosidase
MTRARLVQPFYPRAMERQLELLKSMGCNAIRTSHNCPAPELLELCDKMGILVIDEIFDKYDKKADILDTTDFATFAQRNVKNFVQRDRNHPSIFLWSVGNEIGDVQWNKNGGFEKLRTMVNAVRQYDMSRPVTLVCDSRNSASLRHFDYYDVHSWNYGRRYDLARQLEPNKAVIISESASTVSTRGFYEWPLPQKKTDFTKSLQVSSYDLNAPEWAEIPDDDFMWQQEENYVAGEFVWTGFDYLGEPTPYDPWSIKKLGLPDSLTSVSSYFGIFDLVGLPKDRYYLYKSYWNARDTTIHILPHWNWKGHEGDTIPVFVYTNGDCAELFLNGKTLGMQCKKPDSPVSTERFRLMWKNVKYEPGELKAIAYKEGVALGSELVKTAGEPYQLKLTCDKKSVPAGQTSLAYLTIEVLDKNGIACPLADNLISFEINGPGIIYRTGNGNPQSTVSFDSKEVKLFFGKAVAILQSNGDPGTFNITAKSAHLKDAAISIVSESGTIK